MLETPTQRASNRELRKTRPVPKAVAIVKNWNGAKAPALSNSTFTKMVEIGKKMNRPIVATIRMMAPVMKASPPT